MFNHKTKSILLFALFLLCATTQSFAAKAASQEESPENNIEYVDIPVYLDANGNPVYPNSSTNTAASAATPSTSDATVVDTPAVVPQQQQEEQQVEDQAQADPEIVSAPAVVAIAPVQVSEAPELQTQDQQVVNTAVPVPVEAESEAEAEPAVLTSAPAVLVAAPVQASEAPELQTQDQQVVNTAVLADPVVAEADPVVQTAVLTSAPAPVQEDNEAPELHNQDEQVAVAQPAVLTSSSPVVLASAPVQEANEAPEIQQQKVAATGVAVAAADNDEEDLVAQPTLLTSTAAPVQDNEAPQVEEQAVAAAAVDPAVSESQAVESVQAHPTYQVLAVQQPVQAQSVQTVETVQTIQSVQPVEVDVEVQVQVQNVYVDDNGNILPPSEVVPYQQYQVIDNGAKVVYIDEESGSIIPAPQPAIVSSEGVVQSGSASNSGVVVVNSVQETPATPVSSATTDEVQKIYLDGNGNIIPADQVAAYQQYLSGSISGDSEIVVYVDQNGNIVSPPSQVPAAQTETVVPQTQAQAQTQTQTQTQTQVEVETVTAQSSQSAQLAQEVQTIYLDANGNILPADQVAAYQQYAIFGDSQIVVYVDENGNIVAPPSQVSAPAPVSVSASETQAAEEVQKIYLDGNGNIIPADQIAAYQQYAVSGGQVVVYVDQLGNILSPAQVATIQQQQSQQEITLPNVSAQVSSDLSTCLSVSADSSVNVQPINGGVQILNLNNGQDAIILCISGGIQITSLLNGLNQTIQVIGAFETLSITQVNQVNRLQFLALIQPNGTEQVLNIELLLENGFALSTVNVDYSGNLQLFRKEEKIYIQTISGEDTVLSFVAGNIDLVPSSSIYQAAAPVTSTITLSNNERVVSVAPTISGVSISDAESLLQSNLASGNAIQVTPNISGISLESLKSAVGNEDSLESLASAIQSGLTIQTSQKKNIRRRD